MQAGDVLETAIWLNGEETDELLSRFRADLSKAIVFIEEQEHVIIKPIQFVEKRPDTHRVPPVPAHIHGPNVRLLVAEAEVLCRQPFVVTAGSFLLELESSDLERLRTVTRKVAPHQLTDAECDEIIEEIGPEAALATVREAVDTGRIH